VACVSGIARVWVFYFVGAKNKILL